jgi:hypothetical protein
MMRQANSMDFQKLKFVVEISKICNLSFQSLNTRQPQTTFTTFHNHHHHQQQHLGIGNSRLIPSSWMLV